jgi:precorrin-6B methylase 2
VFVIFPSDQTFRLRKNPRPAHRSVLAGPPALSIPPEEQALIETAAGLSFQTAAVVTVGRGQLASRLALRGNAVLWCPDAWLADQCANESARSSQDVVLRPRVHCQPDWPPGPFDLAAVPLASGGSEELALETLEAAWLSLRAGGHLIAGIPAASAAWLRKSLAVFSPELTEAVWPGPRKNPISVFTVVSSGRLKRHRNWQCQLAFRDQGRLIRLVTRPGVFAHRQLDNGARQLLNAAEVPPGSSVLDIGCGSGAVALGLAARDPSIRVLAVDSYTRAIQCTELGRELNGLENVRTLLSHTGAFGEPASFDLAVANPPYFSSYQIAELFCTAAAKHLKPHGQLLIVTKTPDWFQQRMPDWFEEVAVRPSGRYFIASGRTPRRAGG